MSDQRAEFTREMRKTHTIYMPDMLHYHNTLLKAAFSFAGYKLDIVPEYPILNRSVFGTVNADYCTCSIGIVGNLLTMIEDPRFQNESIAFLEPQAGGACRAGNYYHLIINCLKRTGHEDIPVLSLNWNGQEKHSGFRINLRMISACASAICFSDLLMALLLQIKPYEKYEGATLALYEKWIARLYHAISHGRMLFQRKKVYQQIAAEFRAIELDSERIGHRKKVGIVGEIYIKFSPIGNCHLEQLLERNDCEYRLGGFLQYCIFVMYSDLVSAQLNRKNPGSIALHLAIHHYLCHLQNEMNQVLDDYHFTHDAPFDQLKKHAGEIISDKYMIGDGWLVTGETIDHIQKGYDRVLSVHPFGCLVSHVASRGTMKKIKQFYPKAKVHSIEYDYEQSEAMRESRILLAIH